AALLRRPDRLAERELCALSRSDRRDPCQVAAREWRDRKTLAAGLRRVPGRLHQSRRRPVLSGILFGLLAYKPQFGLLIPVALLMAGQWRAISAAALTVIALMAVTTLAF